MNKKELLKQADDIFNLVSLLRVRGDAVDLVAAVREKLRRLRKDIETLPATKTDACDHAAAASTAPVKEDESGLTAQESADAVAASTGPAEESECCG